MPVSGLVVSLAEEQQLREHAMDASRREPRIEVGAIESGRMAIVIDTTSTEEDKQLWNWLSSLPGVVFVDVALVGYEDQSAGDGNLETPPRNASKSVTRASKSR